MCQLQEGMTRSTQTLGKKMHATSTKVSAEVSQTRADGLKLHQGSLGWVLGRNSFTKRVVEHWNMPLKEEVESPSLEVFEDM